MNTNWNGWMSEWEKRKPQGTRIDPNEISSKYMAYEPNCYTH